MAIDTVAGQKKLTPRRAPYWYRLGLGQHVGLRVTGEGHAIWQAKAYDPATQKEAYRSLGDFSGIPANERYTEAVKAARDWFTHLGRGGRSDAITVRQACAQYVERLRKEKGEAPAADAAYRFQRYIESDPVAAIALPKLTRKHLEAWRDRLEAVPAIRPKRGPNCKVTTAPPPPRERSDAAVNRDMVSLRAALNLAKRNGYITTDAPWAEALAPTKGAGGRRTLYLTRAERRALIDALPQDCAAFVHGLCLLPLRPGALASLTVRNFNARQGVLTIGKDKAGQDRSILLPATAVALIRDQAKGKLPTAPLFARWDGRAWDRDAWKKPIRAAATAAGLPQATTAYTLRHSGITDLVSPPKDGNGNDLAGLDLFTVAALSGTSVAMIEKHYGHLQQGRAQAALAGLAL